MKTVFFYRHVNRFGVWTIAPIGDFWEIAHTDETLGQYKNLVGAHEDFVRGFCFHTSNGMDPSDCELPDDLADWEQVRIAHL
ncbi:hypothetical protein [uncultured Ruegeria sp.]|uniref:hypothetical protein n=1 Tax=uncultured Ruegeria sp. TaxID=259304 RepID=UPI00262606E4|nr:hypothetical protein [uncultured Ruegeria sp.]